MARTLRFCRKCQQTVSGAYAATSGFAWGFRRHQFSDGEISVSLYESVRGSDVFIIQSTCQPVNDNLMELLIMIDACKRVGRQNHSSGTIFWIRAAGQEGQSQRPYIREACCQSHHSAGADRVLTMDLHASQIQGFLISPSTTSSAARCLPSITRRNSGRTPNVVVVSPDVGSVARARTFALKLGLSLAIIDKRREKANQSEVMNIIGDVRGKDVILYDDMVDTAGSLVGAAKALVEAGGAKTIYACATHGVLSGPAIQRVNDSYIKELIFTDTIPYPAGQAVSEKIKYISAAPLFAEAIDRVYEEVSISTLFR